MNILEFNLDIWKLFAEQIGCLELKNLLFVNKELFEKVPVLVGTNSLIKYKKLYTKEYYKDNIIKMFNDYSYPVTFEGKKDRFKMLKSLHKDERKCGSVDYNHINFINRSKNAIYKNEYKNISLSFSNCINLPETYSGNLNLITFENCVVEKILIESDIRGLDYRSCILTGSLTIKKAYVVGFVGCKFEKDFKIVISDGCDQLDVLGCLGYMPIIEGEIDEKKIRNNNFVKIETQIV